MFSARVTAVITVHLVIITVMGICICIIVVMIMVIVMMVIVVMIVIVMVVVISLIIVTVIILVVVMVICIIVVVIDYLIEVLITLIVPGYRVLILRKLDEFRFDTEYPGQVLATGRVMVCVVVGTPSILIQDTDIGFCVIEIPCCRL